MLSYFTHRPKKQEGQADDGLQSPVLNEDDEKFLEKITSDEEPPPLPARPTLILDNGDQVRGEEADLVGADQVPLPTSPPAEEPGDKGEAPADKDGKDNKRTNYLSYIQQIPSVQLPNFAFSKDRSKERAGADLASAAEAVKEGKDLTQERTEVDQEKEKRDIASILDSLNLGAVNNRVFSFSKESQKLMEDFNQILKDIVNGVPTAYDDLEKLLTRNQQQLQKMYGNMPPFLQTLVKSLPAKMSTTLAPELMAAMSEKPGADAKKMEEMAGEAQKQKKKAKRKVPPLKNVVKQQGAVAGMLRSILNFLKMRFPAFMTGTNILMSLAVFLLLFVFWYCHKRGRETRLEKEKLAAEADDGDETVSELEESAVLEKTEDGEPPITIHTDPAAGDKPSTSVSDLPDVLSQPEPKEVPLPSPEADKDLK